MLRDEVPAIRWIPSAGTIARARAVLAMTGSRRLAHAVADMSPALIDLFLPHPVYDGAPREQAIFLRDQIDVEGVW